MCEVGDRGRERGKVSSVNDMSVTRAEHVRDVASQLWQYSKVM